MDISLLFTMPISLSLWIKMVFSLLLILIGLFILYILSPIVVMLVISGFLTILMSPLVDRGEKYDIPSWVTVIGIYVAVFLLGSIVIGTLVPIVINYVTDTATLVIHWVNTAQETYLKNWIAWFHFNSYIEKVILFVFGEKNIGHTLDIIKQNAGSIQAILTNQISSLTTGGISIVSAVGGVVANWLLIGVTTFLMVLERREIGKFILSITPPKIDAYLANHYYSVQKVCSAWIRATLILGFSIFITTYIGLTLAEWIFWFSTGKTITLALIGGIMEFIPYIWPILSFIPAFIIGLGISWKAAIVIIGLYGSIQFFENNYLVPKIMSKALDLSPFLVFVVMLAGASLWGIIGIILAVPIAWVARVIYGEYFMISGSEKSIHYHGSRKVRDTEEKNITTNPSLKIRSEQSL